MRRPVVKSERWSEREWFLVGRDSARGQPAGGTVDQRREADNHDCSSLRPAGARRIMPAWTSPQRGAGSSIRAGRGESVVDGERHRVEASVYV